MLIYFKKNAIQILTFELYCIYSNWCIVSLDNTQPYFIVTCVSMERQQKVYKSLLVLVSLQPTCS